MDKNERLKLYEAAQREMGENGSSMGSSYNYYIEEVELKQ